MFFFEKCVENEDFLDFGCNGFLAVGSSGFFNEVDFLGHS